MARSSSRRAAFPTKGGARSTDVCSIVMPMFHIGGRIEQLAYTIVGATIVLHGSFDATAILRSIEAERVTSAHLAPIMVQRLLDSADLVSTDKSTLRAIHYASAAMPVPTLRGRSLPSGRSSRRSTE